MKHIESLRDPELLSKTQSLVKEEREITTLILRHLREIERRRLFAAQGFSSLHEFAVKFLGYSEAAAHRRISSMRLLRELPELERSLEEGSLSLSTLSTVQSFFVAERKRTDTPRNYTSESKLEILKAVQGMSRRECERHLATVSPKSIPSPEQSRALNSELTELRVVVTQDFLDMLDQIRDLAGNRLKSNRLLELLNFMADTTLNKLTPLAHSQNRNLRLGIALTPSQSSPGNRSASDSTSDSNSATSSVSESTSPATSAGGGDAVSFTQTQMSPGSIQIHQNRMALHRPNLDRPSLDRPSLDKLSRNRPSRAISASIRREIWLRAKGRCEYIEPGTQRRCAATRYLQVDHIRPIALGGDSTTANLRILCSAHNQFSAIKKLGIQQMSKWIPELKSVNDAT